MGFHEVLPVDLPPEVQRWLARVIQEQMPFEKIVLKASDDSYAFSFEGDTFDRLLETIKSFPKAYPLYSVAYEVDSMTFQCDRHVKKPKRK